MVAGAAVSRLYLKISPVWTLAIRLERGTICHALLTTGLTQQKTWAVESILTNG
jgi:hypothetical protein